MDCIKKKRCALISRNRDSRGGKVVPCDKNEQLPRNYFRSRVDICISIIKLNDLQAKYQFSTIDRMNSVTFLVYHEVDDDGDAKATTEFEISTTELVKNKSTRPF